MNRLITYLLLLVPSFNREHPILIKLNAPQKAPLINIVSYLLITVFVALMEYNPANNYGLLTLCLGLVFLPAISINLMDYLFASRQLTIDEFSADMHLTKKYDYVNINKYKGSFNLLGFIFVFLFLIGLFSWKTYENIIDPLQLLGSEEEIEMEIPPTTQPPPPPPPPVTQIEVVEDEEIIEEEEIEEVEIDEEEEVEFEVVEEEVEEDEIFMIVEQQPEFPGGNDKLFKFLSNNLRYPPQAVEMDIEGMVVVQFVVDKKGSINDIKIIKPLGGGCDEESIRIVKAMPKWKPGKQRGKSVNVRFNLPIRFVLR
jgi:protein TonB